MNDYSIGHPYYSGLGILPIKHTGGTPVLRVG